MKPALYSIIPSFLILLSGCTTAVVSERTVVTKANQRNVVSAEVVTHPPLDPGVLSTRYELGAYRYPRPPHSLSEKAVERQTRVPANLALGYQTEPSAYVPASFDPLPKSAELEAELANQREMTTRIYMAQQAMIELEQRARGQFEILVSQTEETMRLREELETERARVQRREADLSARLQTVGTAQPESAVAETPSSSSGQPKE